MDVNVARERRAQPRVPLASSAVAFMADQRIECRSVDVSTTGIALWSPITRSPGHFLRVNFSLAPPGGIPRWYDADGVVVRVEPRASGVLLGVQFLVVDDRVVRDLHAFVERSLAGGRRTTATTRMPDAENPPPMTGEFEPPSTGQHPRRRTAEYGTAVEQGTVPPPEPADKRRPTAIPRTAIPRTTVTPPTAPEPAPVADAAELDRLFRDALAQIDAEKRGHGRRRGP